MSDAASEERLERGCRAGDAQAIAEARALLNSNSAYTRGRASEMLALVPEAQLAALLTQEFARFPSTLWWRVLALFGEAHGRLPGAPFTPERVLLVMEQAPSADPDALFHALRALTAASVVGRARVAAPLVTHRDREVAFRALLCVAEERRLSPSELELAKSVKGADRLHALVLRMEQGDSSAGDALVAMLPRSGPYAYHVLETVERFGNARLFPALRRIYRRRLLGQHVSARAAGAAAVMGDPEALVRLREFARSWRPDVRGVAWAELARSGTADNLARLPAMIANDRVGPFVVAELWRSEQEAAHACVLDALEGDDMERRIAACEAAAHLLGEPRIVSALSRLLEHADPHVVAAARSALEASADAE